MARTGPYFETRIRVGRPLSLIERSVASSAVTCSGRTLIRILFIRARGLHGASAKCDGDLTFWEGAGWGGETRGGCGSDAAEKDGDGCSQLPDVAVTTGCVLTSWCRYDDPWRRRLLGAQVATLVLRHKRCVVAQSMHLCAGHLSFLCRQMRCSLADSSTTEMKVLSSF